MGGEHIERLMQDARVFVIWATAQRAAQCADGCWIFARARQCRNLIADWPVTVITGIMAAPQQAGQSNWVGFRGSAISAGWSGKDTFVVTEDVAARFEGAKD